VAADIAQAIQQAFGHFADQEIGRVDGGRGAVAVLTQGAAVENLGRSVRRTYEACIGALPIGREGREVYDRAGLNAVVRQVVDAEQQTFDPL